MGKTDRRVQRTNKQLQEALIELISERAYDAITIQDIVDRANVGRTTFYLHYSNKDDLFMSCHQTVTNRFHSLHSPSLEEWLLPDASPGLIAAYKHLKEARAILNPIFQGQESLLILRKLRDQRVQEIEANLRVAFAETDSIIPFDILANYLAGTEIVLVQWWLEKRQPYTAQEVAQAVHHMRRAAICKALGLSDDE